MKKNIALISFLYFIVSYSFAQQKITIDYIESKLITHQGAEFIGELKDMNSDLYAYDNWNNEGILFVNNKRYYLSNLNFNVTTNTFNSRVKHDQLFSYKSIEIDSVALNNHLFKRVEGFFYEVLFEERENLFLKKYDVKYKEGTVSRLNGSVGKPTISLVYRYLVKINEEIKLIELNKKSILNLVTNEQEITNFEKFVESEHLSYKDEKDTIRMVTFIFKNS